MDCSCMLLSMVLGAAISWFVVCPALAAALDAARTPNPTESPDDR